MDIDKIINITKALSDQTRLTILLELLNKDLCVNELVKITNLSQSNISHQLSILRLTNLVKYEKHDKFIRYSLKDEHVKCILTDLIRHAGEIK